MPIIKFAAIHTKTYMHFIIIAHIFIGLSMTDNDVADNLTEDDLLRMSRTGRSIGRKPLRFNLINNSFGSQSMNESKQE